MPEFTITAAITGTQFLITVNQISIEQRYQISGLKKAGFHQSKIATDLNMHNSTIYREIKRDKGQRGWCPSQAKASTTGLVKSWESKPHLRYSLLRRCAILHHQLELPCRRPFPWGEANQSWISKMRHKMGAKQ